MRIGIFGGSFNPIHNGHMSIARYVTAHGLADEVWFMVSPLNPLKRQQGLADENLRLEMVRLAVEEEERIRACDFEFHLPRPSYTWNTLCALRARYPDNEFSLLIGADNWNIFSRWRHSEDIIRHHPLLVYPRKGYPVDTGLLPSPVRYMDSPEFNVSSTQLRELAARGEDIAPYVPQSVYRFIKDTGLYMP